MDSAALGGFSGPLELTRLVRTAAAACADAGALVAEVRGSRVPSPQSDAAPSTSALSTDLDACLFKLPTGHKGVA